MDSVWILGDQLSRDSAVLADRSPSDTRILMVEADSTQVSSYHRQRLHLVLASMRRFAASLEREGFDVDYRRAPTFRNALAAHRTEFRPARVLVMEPNSWDARRRVDDLDVELVRSDQFLCHYDDFATWADGRERLVMEDFYRWQRVRLGYLMDGDQPAGGRWNFDHANREPPDRESTDWPEPPRSRLTEIDTEVLEGLPPTTFGADPDGTWATSREDALRRLDAFIEQRLPSFGPQQDAMLVGQWSMRHSLLSPYLNIGLLHPSEVCDAAEEAYRSGAVPIESAEGFIRQVIGWREYVWGIYWLTMPAYRDGNALDATRPLPPLFHTHDTAMRCVAGALEAVRDHAYAHHIQRLMVLANLCLLAGVEPTALVDWMRSSFIDGADWVMLPNVLGMGLYADGGVMATKPYAAGGNYIDRMSDYCAGCRFAPTRRTGPDACPFSVLYWDFLDRNHDRLRGNHRIARQLGGARRLSDMAAVRERAVEILGALDRGTL